MVLSLNGFIKDIKLGVLMPAFPIDFSDRKLLGRSGELVSAIGLGTWGIRDYRNAERALIHAIEVGLNLIDTAEMYGSGRAEELVGRVAKLVGGDVFITTKLLPQHFTSRDSAIKAARMSLRRLGLESVDLILIHWPNPSVPISTQVKALEAIAAEGLCRYIGVSNFNLSELIEALSSTSKYDIVVDQVKYNVYHRVIERDLLPYAIREGIAIQAYTPLESGSVANDAKLASIGSKYGKTAVQVALNFLICRPYVVAIPKTEKVERVDEFRGALGWRLSESDVDYIEREFK